MAIALAYLACNDSSTFDAIVAEAAGTDESNPDSWEEAEVYCLICGANLAIFPSMAPTGSTSRATPTPAVRSRSIRLIILRLWLGAPAIPT